MYLSGFSIRIILVSQDEIGSIIPPSQLYGVICIKLVLWLPKMFGRIHQGSHLNPAFSLREFNFFNRCKITEVVHFLSELCYLSLSRNVPISLSI